MVIVDERPETNRYSSAGGSLMSISSMGRPTCSTCRLKLGAGVLLRAIEPLDGINLMKRLRKTNKLTDLARGPGRLAAALEIDQRLDGVDLCANGPLWLGTAVRETAHICTTVRIGITREVGRLLRFYEEGSPFVSGRQDKKSSGLPPTQGE